MATQPAFTPGPWHIAEGGVCAVVCPEDGANVICLEPERVMAASLAKWPENARLIAAAPDLLEALAFYADETAWNQPPVKAIAHELLGPAYENQASKVRLDRGRIARAAIAKARGQ